MKKKVDALLCILSFTAGKLMWIMTFRAERVYLHAKTGRP